MAMFTSVGLDILLAWAWNRK